MTRDDDHRTEPMTRPVSPRHTPSALGGLGGLGEGGGLEGPGACTAAVPSECRLPDASTAPHTARNFVRRTACPVHLTNVEDACLLVSEVVTNALVHGAPPLALSCRCVRTAALFSVTDHRRQLEPIAPTVAASDDESGRGLAIVEQLAAEWGIHDGPDGKSVWFLLDNPPSVA